MEYKKYYKKLIEKVREEGIFPDSKITPSDKNWISFSFGSNYSFGCVINQQSKDIFVELYISNSKENISNIIFDMISQDKEMIQKEFEHQLIWQKLQSKKASRIKLSYLNPIFPIEENDEDKYINWHSDMLKKFKKVFSAIYGNNFKNIEIEDTIIKDEKISILHKIQPLNQILYGPPGTGKTYNTINRALEIVLEKEPNEELEEILKKDIHTKEEREKLKDAFEEYKKSGHIEFVTFHQSYGYEEFVEGIKASTSDNIIKYSVESGIFKKLSKIAKENYVDSQKSSEQLEEEKSLKEKIELFLIDARDNNRIFNLSQKNNDFQIIDIDDNNIIATRTDETLKGKVVKLNLDEFYEVLKSENNFKTGREVAKMFNRSNPSRNDTYYFNLIKPFKSFSFKNEKIIVQKENLKNHILIIDEINRGNISKIFGELITLIEPSKRIGEDEEIFLKLPNSSELFGVPSNLYIIGTMNTADRSIAQIDTALRRRFEFVEMMPQHDLLRDVIVEDEKEIEVAKLLEAINERIEYIYDREHTIGHSYFMPLLKEPTKAKLDAIFRVNIIPLLAEYFYSDWDDICEVLNDDNAYFIKQKELTYKPKKDRGNKVYSVNHTFEVDGYINIYNGLKQELND